MEERYRYIATIGTSREDSWLHTLLTMEKSRDRSRRLRALKREFFYHYDTADGVSVPQVVFDNIRNCVVYDFSNYDLVFLT